MLHIWNVSYQMEFLKAVPEKCILFWIVAPCSLVGVGTIVMVESAVLPTQKMETECSYDSY